MMDHRFAALALVCAASIAATGCAGPEKIRGELRYGMEDSRDGKRVFFPPPPDVPRLAYAGELIGERNFVHERAKKGLGSRILDALTGVSEDARPLELLRPQAVVTDAEGRVWVTDVGQAAVFVFDTVEGEARLLRNADGQKSFITPSGIAIGPEGRVFVADADAGFVAQLDATGRTFAPIGAGLFKRPAGVSYDKSQKRLFVADSAEHVVKVFDLEGRLLMTIGKPGDAPGDFNRPTHLAIWRNELFVSDTFNARIQVFDLDSGIPLRTFGTRGTYVGQMALPKGVALDSEGNVYVIESLHDHMLVFDRKGQFLLPIGGTGYGTGAFYLPAGLWVDEGNRIYVADMYNGRVVTYLYLGSESESGE